MDDVELTKVLCSELGELPGWVWKPDGQEYLASEVGVFYGAIREKPDQAAGVRVYGGSDDLDVSRRNVQLIIRGATGEVDGADKLATQARDQLHERSNIPGIAFIQRTSFGPLGVDSNGREERSENYRIILENKEA